MNLDRCTTEQRECIMHVNGPLLVSAGAGSGKTFTLTQRIAYALLPDSGPAVGSIDQVLAITFTQKAAEEIKARVRQTLRAEGLAQEALKVDAAWISTIHGMCARILRAHALELGIDPQFGVVSDAQRTEMLSAAINDALGPQNDIVPREAYARLFDEFPARATMGSSIQAFLFQLISHASSLRGGLAAVQAGPQPVAASALARQLLCAYQELEPLLMAAGKSAAAERAKLGLAESLQALQAFLADADAANDMQRFAGMLEGCLCPAANFGKADYKEQAKACKQELARIAAEVSCGLARPALDQLLALADDAQQRYAARKHDACVLDNDDLLTLTLQAFEQHPAIAQMYEHRFKLVMVDEFQDTSQLQIDMIARLAGQDCAHLCTVGDAQQSIYRFRGADVNVYRRHRDDMRGPAVGALYRELKQNFRSHRDVLSFVDRIFRQECSFGSEFMSLGPDDKRASAWQGAGPRIDLLLVTKPAGTRSGISLDDCKQEEARGIAQRFAALREQGHQASQMVVLLGKMSRAGLYAQALREQGFECVIAGGSLFSSAPEVQLVARLAQALANPASTAALFEVLSSDLLHLSADDLLDLATRTDAKSGELRRRNLDAGFAALRAQEDLPPRLDHAVRVLNDGFRAVRQRGLSAAVLQVVVDAGWMDRLQQQGATGIATAANVLKAQRLLQGLERERHLGPASAAREFAAQIEAGLKEAPGALSGAGGNVVKIMTIHASKGLEFPIVAVAEFDGTRAGGGKLLLESKGPCAFASLGAGWSLDAYPNVVAKRAAEYAPCDEGEQADPHLLAAQGYLDACVQGQAPAACGAAPYRAALSRFAAREELAEGRRKLYVALTRASEALVVAMSASQPGSGKPFRYSDLVDDVRSALCGQEGDFPEGASLLEYGGTEPAGFQRVMLGAATPAEGEGQPDAQAGGPVAEPALGLGSVPGFPAEAAPPQFSVPVAQPQPAVPCRPFSSLREGVFSYSSIAPHLVGASEDEPSQGAARDAAAALPGEGQPSMAAHAGQPNALAEAEPEGGPAACGAADADKATGLGSAFHRAAQFAAETGRVPDDARLAALSAAYGLSAAQAQRFRRACDAWFASRTFSQATSCGLVRAEVPFFIPLAGEYLEGEIDLLCTDGPDQQGGRALIVDYKTGGSDAEPPPLLQEKHRLQATCYAYACLLRGYDAVELRFVRVERLGADGSPQEVRYEFSQADREALRRDIAQARQAALG